MVRWAAAGTAGESLAQPAGTLAPVEFVDWRNWTRDFVCDLDVRWRVARAAIACRDAVPAATHWRACDRRGTGLCRRNLAAEPTSCNGHRTMDTLERCLNPTYPQLHLFPHPSRRYPHRRPRPKASDDRFLPFS